MRTKTPLRPGLLVLLAVLIGGPLTAQSNCTPTSSLTTTFAGGNGCSGNYFDVMTTNFVNVCTFDVHIGSTVSETVEVWAVTGGGSYVPVANTSTAWTLLATTSVTAAGAGSPTPLNLNLNYAIPAGTTQGFLIRLTTSTSIDYTNGGTAGAPYASNADLTIFEGNYTCTTGTAFPTLTNATRVWNGTIHYNSTNLLSITDSGPGVGDLTITLDMVSPTATEGWLLLSFDTSQPAGSGPLLGIVPDGLTFAYFFGSPLFDGNPFHFPVPSPSGMFFPTMPFSVPPGTNLLPPGTTMDVVAFLIGPGFTYDSASAAVRYTFQ